MVDGLPIPDTDPCARDTAGRPTAPGAVEGLALAIAWAPLEPSRLGEFAHVPAAGGEHTLGRGPGPPGDPRPRLAWCRAAPGVVLAQPPLAAGNLSRVQLGVRAVEGCLEVRRLGRAALRSEAGEVESARLAPGQVIKVVGVLLLVCVRRPHGIAAWRWGEYPAYPFGEPDGDGLIGESAAMWGLRSAVHTAARLDGHVLVHGPSGTGKELLARAVHAHSARRDRPLVARNAATIPESIAAAELFGNVRNYPNHGMPERPGLVGEADGSTLFLDEVGEVPTAVQAQLLRVMDSGEYQRLGAARTTRVDVRFVAATNRPLGDLKHDFLARFRHRIAVPGLGDRREDVPLLARHLLRPRTPPAPGLGPGEGDPNGRASTRMTSRLVRALLEHEYRGHVRELDRLLCLAVESGDGQAVDLTPSLREELERACPPFRPVGNPAGAGGVDSAPPPEPCPAAGRRGCPLVDPSTPCPHAAPSGGGDAHDAEGIDPVEIQRVLDRHNGIQAAAWRDLGLSSRHVLARLVRRHGLVLRRVPRG